MAQLGAVLVAEIGDDDDQRAPVLPAQQVLRGGRRSRNAWASAARRTAGPSAHSARARPLRGANERSLAGRRAERHRADRVALLERHGRSAASPRSAPGRSASCRSPPARSSARMRRPQSTSSSTHWSRSSWNSRTIGLPSRSVRAPVHVAHCVADAVVGQLLEVGALRRAAGSVLTPISCSRRSPGKPRVARNLGEVGVDAAHLGTVPSRFEQLAQSPARADPHHRPARTSPRPPGRGDRVGGLDATCRRGEQPDRQPSVRGSSRRGRAARSATPAVPAVTIASCTGRLAADREAPPATGASSPATTARQARQRAAA